MQSHSAHIPAVSHLSLGLLLIMILSLSACEKEEQTLSIIPLPASIERQEGQLYFSSSCTLSPADSSLTAAADYLNERLQRELGFTLLVRNKPDVAVIQLKIDPLIGRPEGYHMTVEHDRISIRGNDEAGVFYGIQTLFQLIKEMPAKEKGLQSQYIIPFVKIFDYPRFRWRGMHLDVSRHFFGIDFIKKQLDIMARHKLNVFHWHLTDDQGWRIEIKKYPLLTQIGAWRADRETQPWDKREPLKPGESPSYGGFYTQDQIRDVVAYAARLHITVIPEIEMPGHAVAALAAYPELSCSGEKMGVMPGAYWPITHIFCAGNDKTFEFLEDVLTEAMDLFPSTFIHIGGDEAVKTEWAGCPKCLKRMESENLSSVKELEGYFFRRIENVLIAHNRRLIGWDKVLNGGLTSGAAIMSWKGDRGAVPAANEGHDVVMTPADYMYFDQYQAESGEPGAIGGYLPLEKVYSFDPVPAALDSSEQEHILGVQANVWTEYIQTEAHAEYMIYPRQCALAEVAWSQKEGRDYINFLIRMDTHCRRLERWGINYRRPDVMNTASR
jgi:hexosaminidase